MRKKFALNDTKKAPERVLESVKHEIRKYIKREKRKVLPDGADFWKIDCKFAKNENELQDIKFEDITQHIDEVSKENCESFTIELISKSAKKAPRIIEETIEEIDKEEI